MVSESMPNICKPGCPGNRRGVCPNRSVPSCPPCPAMANTMALHHDIHKVIDTMGPPTPMFPLDLGCESADETTNSSTHFDETENNTPTNNSSNTSFVEVLIKNHHKNKKSKIIEEEVPKKSKSSININNSAVLVDDTKTSKEVQFQDYASSALSSPVQEKSSNKMEPQGYPSGIITGARPSYPPCPHAPFSSSFQQISNKSMSNGMEQSKSKQSGGNSQNNNRCDQNCQNRIYNQNNREGLNRPGAIYGNDSKDSVINCMPESQCYTSNCKPPEPNLQSAELYYFDHGNAAYFHTTDCPPTILADYLAEKTENAATRFWAQIFGIANVAVSLFTAFILQFLRFILFSIVRPLTVGIIQLFSDYFLKPLLSSVFNGLIQPPLIFIFNILTSLRDLFQPIAHALGFFCKEIAVLFRACRLVEIKRTESARIV